MQTRISGRIFLLVSLLSATGWSQSYTLSTVAGIAHHYPGQQATASFFVNPSAMAVDAAGNVFLADDNVFRIPASGILSPYAGGPYGYVFSMAMDANGSLYIGGFADIYKVTTGES